MHFAWQGWGPCGVPVPSHSLARVSGYKVERTTPQKKKKKITFLFPLWQGSFPCMLCLVSVNNTMGTGPGAQPGTCEGAGRETGENQN